MDKTNIYKGLGIDEDVFRYGEGICDELSGRFARIDEVSEINQLKVIGAMQECRVSEACLGTTTGYGYNDIGRDTLEEVYAKVFHTEAALVRPLIACGTHALAIALFGNLRPGDELISIAGKPYDTLEEVIGIRPSRGSLAEYGITYSQVDLLPNGIFDLDGIKKAISDKTKMVTIQRSKGYEVRKTLSVAQIGEAIACVKSVRPDIICMVDNCYGEFTETIEPSDVGADLIVGSLIKNPGGGLAPVGGYIAGKAEYVENASYRMTCPGLGSEVGPSLGVNPAFYQGFFMAPIVTASALKGAIFAANVYERLGFSALPDGKEDRHDIIRRKLSSLSAREYRRPHRSTPLSPRSPGICQATTTRSSWRQAHLFRDHRSNCRPTARSVRRTQSIFRAGSHGRPPSSAFSCLCRR